MVPSTLRKILLAACCLLVVTATGHAADFNTAKAALKLCIDTEVRLDVQREKTVEQLLAACATEYDVFMSTLSTHRATIYPDLVRHYTADLQGNR